MRIQHFALKNPWIQSTSGNIAQQQQCQCADISIKTSPIRYLRIYSTLFGLDSRSGMCSQRVPIMYYDLVLRIYVHKQLPHKTIRLIPSTADEENTLLLTLDRESLPLKALLGSYLCRCTCSCNSFFTNVYYSVDNYCPVNFDFLYYLVLLWSAPHI